MITAVQTNRSGSTGRTEDQQGSLRLQTRYSRPPGQLKRQGALETSKNTVPPNGNGCLSFGGKAPDGLSK
jgi:hypothetical protein